MEVKSKFESGYGWKYVYRRKCKRGVTVNPVCGKRNVKGTQKIDLIQGCEELVKGTQTRTETEERISEYGRGSLADVVEVDLQDIIETNHNTYQDKIDHYFSQRNRVKTQIQASRSIRLILRD